MEEKKAEELIRRLAAALRGTELYSPKHPLVQRGIDALTAAALERLQSTHAMVIGFIGDEVVVDGTPPAARDGVAHRLRERSARSRYRESDHHPRRHAHGESPTLVAVFSDRTSTVPLPDRLLAAAVRARDARPDRGRGGQRRPGRDRGGAPRLRHCGGDRGNPLERREGRRSARPGRGAENHRRLARLVTQDRTSLMALTALKKYDNYTFTHMVNVSALAMAQARALNIDGTLLREFGFAALMHDIGKVNHAARGPEQARQADQRGVRRDEASTSSTARTSCGARRRCRRWRRSSRSSIT